MADGLAVLRSSIRESLCSEDPYGHDPPDGIIVAECTSERNGFCPCWSSHCVPDFIQRLRKFSLAVKTVRHGLYYCERVVP
ncbi:hypothetical protein BD311DRAFT_757705 [Dichomitus squalens]|uniref:Uncharacterized protein n=1 Tax=Dichomitus squalens TaxID=114155 RepID=A0A4Q9MPG7_9APHY|nr:hypothetical protein BD311DRAFT_757705 [Dichomitus squalens]